MIYMNDITKNFVELLLNIRSIIWHVFPKIGICKGTSWKKCKGPKNFNAKNGGFRVHSSSLCPQADRYQRILVLEYFQYILVLFSEKETKKQKPL